MEAKNENLINFLLEPQTQQFWEAPSGEATNCKPWS